MAAARADRLMPGGIPKYIRCYDNGGGSDWWCGKCLKYHNNDLGSVLDRRPGQVLSTCPDCGGNLKKAPKGSFDRFTIVLTGNYADRLGCDYLSASCRPYHPQGFGQTEWAHCIIDAPKGWPPAIGRLCHLGYRVPFENLPDDVKRFVLEDYKATWSIDHV